MHSIALVCVTLLPLILAQLDNESRPHKMVVYWGQQWQNKKPLEHYCLNNDYDKIVLSFLQIFFDARNKDNFPQISFASGCSGSVADGYPTLLRCPEIERGIKQCQQRGIQVTLSLGGWVGQYGFKDVAEIRLMAFRVWNLFLNGDVDKHLRPFGDAVLDGIDVNIAKGSTYGYGEFVKELRNYMSKDISKEYILSAPPACPFPNHIIGPDSGNLKNTALGQHGDKFTDIYVQFLCCGCTPGSETFWARFKQWTDFANEVRNAHNGRGPKIYIGLPAHAKATGAEGGEAYFRPVHEIRAVYNRAKLNPGFGGFMLWNAGFDDLSKQADGRTYGDHLVGILEGK